MPTSLATLCSVWSRAVSGELSHRIARKKRSGAGPPRWSTISSTKSVVLNSSSWSRCIPRTLSSWSVRAIGVGRGIDGGEARVYRSIAAGAARYIPRQSGTGPPPESRAERFDLRSVGSIIASLIEPRCWFEYVPLASIIRIPAALGPGVEEALTPPSRPLLPAPSAPLHELHSLRLCVGGAGRQFEQRQARGQASMLGPERGPSGDV